MSHVLMGMIVARDDYLVWGIATSFIALLGSAKDGGASKLLLQGLNRSDHDVKHSVSYGRRVVGASFMAALVAAPLLGFFYQSNRVAALIGVGALAIALNGLSMLPKAKITVAGKYSEIGRIEMVTSFVSTATLVGCGLLGLGAFSFAIALTAGATFRLTSVYTVSKHLDPSRKIPNPTSPLTTSNERRWLLASTIATALIMNVDYMVLGVVAPEILAAYFFGFQLTLTLSALVAPAMEQTLLPYFSRLGDSSGQDTSVRKMLSAISIIVTPVGLFVALIGPSLVNLIWGTKWTDATPVIQIFTAGVGVRLLLPVLVTHLQSQREWKRVALFYYADATFVFLATLVSARFGLVAVAAAVTIARSISIFAILTFALRDSCGALAIGRILMPYATLAFVVAWAVRNSSLLLTWNNQTLLGGLICTAALSTVILATSWPLQRATRS